MTISSIKLRQSGASAGEEVLTSHISSTTSVHGIADTSLLATESYVDAAVAGLDPLPAQSGNSGKFLTTDGTDSSWATVATGSSEQTFTNNFMMMGA